MITQFCTRGTSEEMQHRKLQQHFYKEKINKYGGLLILWEPFIITFKSCSLEIHGLSIFDHRSTK